MIYDDTAQARQYFPANPAWLAALDHLSTLSAASPDGESVLIGNRRLVAIVQTYHTRPVAECVIESHERYIDLQVVLEGEEWLDTFVRDTLTIKTPYSPDSDATFYEPAHAPDPPPARVSLVPGRFALLFPADAHRPQVMPLTARRPGPIRKVVYKIERRLIINPQ